MKHIVEIIVSGLLLAGLLAGCEALKSSKPIVPVSEYERLLVGRLDANYVGADNCLSACHFHDRLRRDFEASTMGAQLSSKSGMPLVDCESCHGPGSLAIEGITPEKVEEDAKNGVQTKCRYETLLEIKELPSGARSLICLRCHTANATFNLHSWSSGAHAIEDVTCSDCHDIHAGADLIVSPKDTKDMCLGCHEKEKAEFSLRSRHPVKENKILCTDCHDPHGTFAENLLRDDTIKETCARCHGEKEGPFVFEHADVMDRCTACHRPHGSAHNNLLVTQEAFLCLQCHQGHGPVSSTTVAESMGALYTRCTDCHSQIHGTDLPSPGGKGRFIN